MAFAFDVVSPERKLASGEADAVQIPGAEGDLTAMPNHAPFLTTLRPGVVKVRSGNETTEFVVTGGFVEVSPESAAVLAEEAVTPSEADAAWFEAKIEAAEAMHAAAEGEAKIIAAQRINDFRFLKEQLGA